MNDFTTELVQCLSSGMDATELFRKHLEKAINYLLETERTAFLDYEKWDPIGYNSGNSRNGYYTRCLKTMYGSLTLQIPRDRLGEFNQQTIPPHKQQAENLERTIIQLYQKGITPPERLPISSRKCTGITTLPQPSLTSPSSSIKMWKPFTPGW